MSSFDSIEKWLLRLELRYIRKKPFLEHIPQLRFFNRKITADLTIISPVESGSIRFKVDFRTPNFRLPIAVEQTQVGRETSDGVLETASPGYRHTSLGRTRYSIPAVRPDLARHMAF